MNTEEQKPNVLQVPIEDIIPNRAQPRLYFDEQSLNELADSIKSLGIIQPLVLRRIGDKYEIIAGERRYRAAKIAGLSGVPAILTTMNDAQSAEAAIVENVQRKDLSAIEEARSYKSILDKKEESQAELARRLGVSPSAISNKLRLLALAEEVQSAVIEGKISERHARSLLKLSTHDEQVEMLNRVINERLTVKQLDNEIKKKIGDVPLVDSEVDVEKIKSETEDIEPLNITNTTEPTEDVIKPSPNNKFFNYLEESAVNMAVSNPTPEPVTPKEETPQIKEVKEELPEETEPTEEVEMLDFDMPSESEEVTKIKSVLEGKEFTITEQKTGSQQIINIIINN